MDEEATDAMYVWMERLYLQEFPETEVFESRYWKEYVKPYILLNKELNNTETGKMMSAGMMSCYIVGFLLGEGHDYDDVCNSGEAFAKQLENLKKQSQFLNNKKA